MTVRQVETLPEESYSDDEELISHQITILALMSRQSVLTGSVQESLHILVVFISIILHQSVLIQELNQT